MGREQTAVNRIAATVQKHTGLPLPCDVEALAACLGIRLIEVDGGPGGRAYVLRGSELKHASGLPPHTRRLVIARACAVRLLRLSGEIKTEPASTVRELASALCDVDERP
jgi:hypothetical protein